MSLLRAKWGPAVSVKELYVKVHEASEILGVAPNTVRKWGAEGKIPEHRHPINGYRLYKREDLEQVLLELAQSAQQTPKRKAK
ncbi:helix-turn-helix domain-containing protein [Blastopirellula marina]|uniref:MerR family DNA-binding transcriptional regulator n=1 Tax=Blastopirellula marina TaxID=124 RepID=A0A2S8F9W2_9BACT|nr:MerR family DNA-binding transcriptional regulator [Blastopirellula marina]PTL42208.1 helix-turn-helix domain-containing protein [Blastopirellula marina]